MKMQTQKNLVINRESSKMQNPTVASYCLSATDKILIMEALDHLHVIRQYQEMGACIVCKKISTKKCFGCGVFYCSNECQTFDWPKHRVLCPKHKENMSERNSLAASKKNRGSFIGKNFNEGNLMLNGRNSPFTALANQLSKKSVHALSGPKSMSNFRIGNRQYRNREKMAKNNETGNNVTKDHKKCNSIDRMWNSPPKYSNRRKVWDEKKEMNNKNGCKDDNSPEPLKTIENMPNDKNTISQINLPKINKMEVLGTFRESSNRYWVMDYSNLQKYDDIQAVLNKECANYDSAFPRLNLICGCTFADEWFRAKITSLTPEIKVHFIDYGNYSNSDQKIFKKLPKDIESVPGLAFLVEFEEGTPAQYKTEDLDSLKLTIEETSKTADGVPRVKIIEGPHGPTLKLRPVKKFERNGVNSTKAKSVMETITAKTNGMLFFEPGEGSTRFASIVPDNNKEASECFKKISNIGSPNLSTFSAVKGDFVFVTDKEGVYHRGKVTTMFGFKYYVQLLDFGNVILAESVYPLPEDFKQLIELGVKVTIEEVILPEKFEKLETCFFTINGERNPGTWQCFLKGTEQQIIAKAILEKIVEAKQSLSQVASIESGSTVEISSLSSSNTVYVRSVDVETEQKFMDMNMEIIQFTPSAKSYTVPPSVGDLCCVRFEEDSCFYRAIVNSVEKGKVGVLFIDFGNEQITDLKDVKPIPESLKNIPVFAVKVKLRNVPDKPWNNMIKEYMTKLASESIELTVTYNGKITDGVILREKLGGVVVNDFIEKNLDKGNETVPTKKNRIKEEVFLDDDLKYTTVPSGSKCVLALLYVDESQFEQNQSIWATIADIDNFNYVNGELSSLISNYCASETKPHTPNFRELCLAEYEGCWYRAACAGCEGKIFKVFFVDFGNICEVESSSIRKMNKDFVKAPALAMNCTLEGGEKLKKNPELTKKVFETLLKRMNSLIDGVTITKGSDEKYFLRIPEIEEILNG